MNSSIEELFNNYKKAFDKFDVVNIARNYQLPCAVTDADGSLVFELEEALVKKFAANCESMKSIGYAGSEYTILKQLDLGESGRAVNIGWRVKLETNSIEFRCFYICHQEDQQWKIFSAYVYPGSFS